MNQYPPLPMGILGLFIAASIGAPLIAPWGPGSSWPPPVTTGVYGILLCFLRRKGIRIFALIVTAGSLVFIGTELNARSKEKAREKARTQGLLTERQIIEQKTRSATSDSAPSAESVASQP